MKTPTPVRSFRKSTPALNAALAVLLGLPLAAASAGTFTWNNTTGNWSDATKWGGSAPTGADVSDILIFGGDVGSVAGTAPNYVATEDLAGTRFLLNQITFNATDAGVTGLDQTLRASAGATGIRFMANGGTGPQMTQNGVGGITLDLPVELGADLTLAATGLGEVTMNYAVSGAADIVKNGPGTFRFGTPFNSTTIPTTGPSANTWVGRLTINDGIIRFNNNLDSGRTALRANPVALGAATAQLTCNSEIRAGTLSGSAGNVQTIVTGGNTSSASVVLHALSDGNYGGALRIDPKTGSGSNDGVLVVRGVATQTLSGTLVINADMVVGRGATLALAGAATVGLETRGAVVLSGGTFKLDNLSAGNNDNRLRDAAGSSTGLDTTGGGSFQLIGSTLGTAETVGRLQLSGADASSVRSGGVSIGVVQNTAASTLSFSTYNRLSATNAFTTVDFTASGGTLGASVSGPRIFFNTAPTLQNLLFANSEVGAPASSVGWATVNGAHFASYGANGVVAVFPTAFNPALSNAAVNSVLTGSATISSGTTYAQSSLEIAPAAAGQSLSLSGAGNLDTTGILLAGATNFSIGNSGVGTGGLAGASTRYLHVTQAALTLGLNVGAAPFPLVKNGAGLLVLTNTDNASSTFITTLNGGTLRATPSTTLPGGALQFRGGVFEIVGGSFARSVGSVAGNVNWRTVGEDVGSGGFAASGTDATVTLSGSSATLYAWEDPGFLNSGHALTFGSVTGDRRVTFTNLLSLSALTGTVNYNAREIRVIDNPSSANDRATLSGVVSGTLQNDLLKTGNGTLELTAANTLQGAILVNAGTLQLTGSVSSSILIDVQNGGVLTGTGTATRVVLENGGRLAPGNGGIGTLNATGCIWRTGGVAAFDLGAVNASDRIALGSGAFTKGSASGTFAFDFGGTGVAGQTYTLATFGSTTFSAADFTATNLAAGVTGTFQVAAGALTFTVPAASPIEAWRQFYFGPGATNSGNAADEADPEKDGIFNLAEYVLAGSNPLQSSTGALPVGGKSGTAPTFTFTRNLSATDVTLTIEAKFALSAAIWTTLATRPGAGPWTPVGGVSVIESGAGVVTLTDTVSIPGTPKRFYRLRVNRP